MDLVIAIPAYDEIETIEPVVRSALAELDALGITGCVFVVDDGSSDGTGEVADRLSREDPRVLVQHHEVNRGFTGAIRTALTTIPAEYVFLTAADGQVPLSVVPAFWAQRDDADIVVGLRRPRADTHWRRLMSWGYHSMARLLLGIPVPEFSSALLFRWTALNVPLESRSRSATLLAEILGRASLARARFAVVPYRHLPRAGGRGKGGDLRVAIRTFFDMIRIAWLIRVSERRRLARRAQQ